MKLPTLYKMNTQGKIEQWEIQVFRSGINYPRIQTTFGELNGKQQTKSFYVKSGKNIGKKNETTLKEQAELEAKAKWEKKLKSGYVEKLEDAKAGIVNKIIKGGINPMLAHKYEDYKDKIKFPVLIQPKLDGQRCIAHFKDGKVTLWTRTRKPIMSCPHIIEELEKVFSEEKREFYLDGELYNHELKHEFEKLMSAVRKQKPSKESLKIQYHVYDYMVSESHKFKTRNLLIEDLLDNYEIEKIKIVQTVICVNHKDIEQEQLYYIKKGYEGIMIRNPESFYENKRSKGLLKMKTFDDDEFKIAGFVKGKDKSVIAVCWTKDNKMTFEATMSGNKDNNQKFLINENRYFGKMLTVKYQGLTGKNGVPRFPVGLRIREEE